jgi:hypothetical protein
MDAKDKMPLEVRAAIEDLLRIAKLHKIIVAGFAFGSQPCFTNFGNCSNMGDIELYLRLCDLAAEKVESGLVVRGTVPPVQ